MKKTLFFVFALFCAMTANAQAVADKVTGTYNGKLYVSLATPTFDNETLVKDADDESKAANYQVMIEKETADEVTFKLPNFSFLNMPLGDIVLTKRKVKADEAAKRSVFGENSPVELSFMGGEILATAKINETGSYVANDGTALIDVDVMWTNAGSEPMPIYVRFEGKIDPKTGIQPTLSKGSEAKTFDLQGRPTSTQAKGLFIVNGKKVIR